jgi:hypothetical protein
MQTYPLLEKEDERQELLLAARVRHRRLLDALAPALAHLHRDERIIKLRRNISDPALQFFIALLLNIRGRNQFLNLVKERYESADPIATIVNWIAALSKLGVLGFRFNRVWCYMMGLLLSGLSNEGIELELHRRYGPAFDNEKRMQSREVLAGLRNYWLFAPMFEQSTARQGPEPTSAERIPSVSAFRPDDLRSGL